MTPGLPDRRSCDRTLFVLGLCRIFSVAIFVIAVLSGGALRNDYDPVQQSISELYEVGADNACGLMVLFTLYHALVIPLAIGLHKGLPPGRLGWLGPWLLGIAGVLGADSRHNYRSVVCRDGRTAN